MKLDHIGFLTEDVEREMVAFERLFGRIEWSVRIVDPLQDVTARFGRTVDGLVYELIQPNSASSPIAASLKARKNIINHVCYRCADLSEKARELREQGFFPVTEPKPGVAFAGHLVQFFYQPNGMLLEIIEGSAGPLDRPQREQPLPVSNP
ncbi:MULTISPECIES: VOC family protein [Bradyrhizobium]|uniref:VOC family protein n=1 Tax=Bradyrhizobium TaxID=374 RepID=UPI0015965D29|nr:VOC family protein [Bradyrhizobium septentrionale]UGY22041.1 VOC family protein [Bradyrhizobium septentrionale]